MDDHDENYGCACGLWFLLTVAPIAAGTWILVGAGWGLLTIAPSVLLFSYIWGKAEAAEKKEKEAKKA